MNNGVIALENLGLKYRLCRERPLTFKEGIFNLSLRRPLSYEDLWALKEINLNIRPGESLGLIGRNGSGKTTLLKIMAHILVPSEGRLTVKGRVSPMLSIGVGFYPELTGRENIYLSGSLLGFSRKEMDDKLEAILSFAELEKFIDIAVRHYSTGMYMRLGFSIATAIEPDILLIDEVLAVGDKGFQAKCFSRLEEFKKKGKTIILVSHDLELISALTERLVLLSNGRIKAMGKPEEVVASYHQMEQGL